MRRPRGTRTRCTPRACRTAAGSPRCPASVRIISRRQAVRTEILRAGGFEPGNAHQRRQQDKWSRKQVVDRKRHCTVMRDLRHDPPQHVPTNPLNALLREAFESLGEEWAYALDERGA